MNESPPKPRSLLRQRAFGGLWVGSIASSTGSSAGLLAMNWLVYAETGSAFDLALIGVAGLVPRILFGLLAGAFADRYNRLHLMVYADTFRAATMIAFALSLLFLGFQLSAMLAVAFVLGLGQSLFRPAINSFLPTVVQLDQRGTANGLFSAAEQITQIVGSPLGGFIIGTLGAAAVFFFNGASYVVSGCFIIAVAISLSAQAKPKEISHSESLLDQIRGGLSFLNRERALMKLTLASFGGNFFSSLFLNFLVIYVTVALLQGPFAYGLLGAAIAIGSGVGSLLVGQLRPEKKFGIWFNASWGVAGVLILGLVLIHNFLTAGIFLLVLGLFGGFGNTTFFTAVQMVVPNEILGRYFSIDEVGSIGAVPAGQIVGALLIASFGIDADFAIAAIGVAAFSFGTLLFSDVRGLKA